VSQAGGDAAACIESLGGLTIDQLRWIFSNYTAELLETTGWDPTSVANSDDDDTTHLWSELSADCPEAEVKIAGHDSESGTYEYFAETVFADMDNGESFDVDRPDGYFNSAADPDIIAFLTDNADAIGYVGYAYYQENQDAVTAAAIENADLVFVAPDATTVADGR
jgi:ABC-type phosphate transport system substrate-binding protein